MHDGDLYLFQEAQVLYSAVVMVGTIAFVQLLHETRAGIHVRALSVDIIAFSLQDLERYVNENRKRDAERLLKGMKRWEWRGLEEGLRKMGLSSSEKVEQGTEDEE